MNKIVCLLLLLVCSGRSQGQSNTWAWTQAAASEVAATLDQVTTQGGSTYATGLFLNYLNFPGSSLTKSGNCAFLAKFGPDGNLVSIRANAFGGGSVQPVSLCVDAAENVYVIGHFAGVVSFDSTLVSTPWDSDLFIAAYDSSCLLKWVRTFGGASTDFNVRGCATTFPGTTGLAVSGTAHNGITIGGQQVAFSGERILLARFDAQGQLLWHDLAAASADPRVSGLSADEHGSLYLSGYVSDTASVGGMSIPGGGLRPFVARYDAGGAPLWVRAPQNDSQWNFALGSAPDGHGGLYLVGERDPQKPSAFGGMSTPIQQGLPGNHYFYIADLDSTGSWQWLRTGVASRTEVSSVKSDADGNLYLCGGFRDSIALEGRRLLTPPYSGSLSTGFALKLRPDGTSDWSLALDGSDLGGTMVTGLSTINGDLFLSGYFLTGLLSDR